MFRAFGRMDGGKMVGRRAAERGTMCSLVYSVAESVMVSLP